MKQTDLQPCIGCGKGVMHSNQMTFYQVRLGYRVINLPAVQRQAGLEMMLGGHAAIAHAMGQDEDMALPLGEDHEVIVCMECAIRHPLMVLSDHANERADAEADASGNDT